VHDFKSWHFRLVSKFYFQVSVATFAASRSVPGLCPALVRAPVLPLWHRKAQHGYITMAEAEYAAGPRLISDSNSFTAWSDVPENLCKTILRLLPSEHWPVDTSQRSHHSATLDGQRDALCTSALLAMKVKGRHGDNYHAEGLESHFARDARHHPDVSAADRAHRRHSLTHSLPTPPHMCVWHTCVPACVRGMCAAACLDTHFHRHMPRHTHAMDCTYAHARACMHWPSLCATLVASPRRHSCSDAHPPPRQSPPRSLGTAVPCAIGHMPNPGAIRRPF
jgi:hypothetical protein